MKYIIKYFVRNVKEKKNRFFLMLFAITLATAVFFTAMSISDIVNNTYEKMTRYEVGESDIVVSDSELFKVKENNIDNIEYEVKQLNIAAKAKNLKEEDVVVNLLAINFSDVEKYNTLVLSEDIKEMNDDDILISRDKAEEYDISIGDTLILTIGSIEEKFNVAGFSESENLFAIESGYMTALVNYSSMEGVFGENVVAKLLVKVKEDSEVEAVKIALSDLYNNQIIDDAVNENAVKPLTKMIKSSFMMIVTLIFFMSVFIIYSAIKVIMKESLLVIGTFRSVGSSTSKIVISLLGEYLVIGIIGGLIGCLVGVGILKEIAQFTNPYKNSNVDPVVVIDMALLIKSFVVAVITTVLSALFPVIGASKKSIKNIILGIEQNYKKFSIPKFIFAVVSISLCMTVLDKLPENGGFIIGIIIVVCTMIGFIFIIPFLVKYLIYILRPLYVKILGHDSYVALANLKGNKSMLNNISIITISISAVILISLSISSATKQISSNYNCYNYDVSFVVRNMDSQLIEEMNELDEVDDAYGVMRTGNISEADSDKIIKRLDAINDMSYLDYVDIDITDAEKSIKELKEGKNILIGDILSYNLGVKEGDNVTLDTPNGEVTYYVIGIFDTKYILSGLYALISEENYIEDIKEHSYEEIWIKTKNPNQAIDKLKEKYTDMNPIVVTKDEQEEDFSRLYENVNKPMGDFVIVAFVVGILGIVNNFFISFMERKREFAVLKSIGMSENQLKKILLIEAFTVGLVGSILAFGLSLLIVPSVPILTKSMGSILLVQLDYKIMLMYCVLGVTMSVLASIMSVRKSKNLSIIKEIRYE